MKLALVATTIFTLTLGLYTPKVTAAPAQTPKTFTEWCEQKGSLSKETRHTVEVLLKVAETQNCSQANQMLTKLKELNLKENQIKNIEPLFNLTNLTNLTFLYLNGNQIRYIQPLSNLIKLQNLEIQGNVIISKQCPLKPESICKF
jgi:internalin A